MAVNSQYTDVVRRLGCLRGISTLTGFGLAVEIGDWSRFSGNSIGSYPGLVPSENSSGQSRSLGPITKTGTVMPVGCWSRPPGTTNTATWRARRSVTAGTSRPQQRGPAGTWATAA